MSRGKSLRIVYMGTPDFAVEGLKALVVGGYNVVGVITNPDKKAGRGQKVSESAVKKYALSQDLPILQPEKFRNEEFLASLKALNADLQIVVAFKMLPEVVWSMPPMGTFNLHASLLPRYRGAAPLNWAVINGDRETGVTTFLLKHAIDTGNVLIQERVEIGPDDTLGDIHDRLMYLGSDVICRTVDGLADGTIEPTSQQTFIDNGAEEKHAPKIFKADCLIDWNQDINLVHNHIRGLSPYPAAWCNLTPLDENGKSSSAKILLAEKVLEEHNYAVGTIKSDGKSYINIYCLGGYMSIKRVQLAGKKAMATDDLLRGFRGIETYIASL